MTTFGDGWRLHVAHETGFAYEGQARASYNEARLTPATLANQMVLATELKVRPSAARWRYVDYFGNQVITFELDEPHEQLVITAESTVETSAPPVPNGALGWDELRSERILDLYDEFLTDTARTTIAADVVDALRVETRELDPHDAAELVSERVRSLLTYVSGATSVLTSAQEALDQGSGVCQDFTHLGLGMLRGIGIPARYVSGYLHPNAEAQPGETGKGESHAWIEYFTGVWNPLDPTSGARVGPRHVVVAWGRDYSDAAPLTGIYHGAAPTEMDVAVTITRLR